MLFENSDLKSFEIRIFDFERILQNKDKVFQMNLNANCSREGGGTFNIPSSRANFFAVRGQIFQSMTQYSLNLILQFEREFFLARNGRYFGSKPFARDPKMRAQFLYASPPKTPHISHSLIETIIGFFGTFSSIFNTVCTVINSFVM